MYETIEVFDCEGLSLEQVLKSCIFLYYETRFLYNKTVKC